MEPLMVMIDLIILHKGFHISSPCLLLSIFDQMVDGYLKFAAQTQSNEIGQWDWVHKQA